MVLCVALVSEHERVGRFFNLCSMFWGTGEVQLCPAESTFNRVGMHLTGQVNAGLSCKQLFHNFSALNLVGSNKCCLVFLGLLQ